MTEPWSTIDSDWRQYPCIHWPGQINADGYGVWAQKQSGKTARMRAHRMVYESTVGAIPKGLVIDHLCRNRSCTNPWHLEPVTRGENVRRGVVGDVQRARHAARTHCKNGHGLSGENVRIVKDGKGVDYRECVTCRREISRRQTERRRKAKLD